MELSLIPDSLTPLGFWGLVILSCFTSILTASIGIGGGTIMLAVMAQVLPVKAVVPVHGVVQLGSNTGRAVVMHHDIDQRLFSWFLLGSLLGALLGGQLVVSLPTATLKIVLGVFILYSVWGPKIGALGKSAYSMASGGFVTTLATMFVGATGPLVVALLKPFNLTPTKLVATSASLMVTQHLLKILVFGLLGFVFAPYLVLLVLMIASGLVGTLLGRKILLKLDAKKFKTGLNLVLTVLALKLLTDAL